MVAAQDSPNLRPLLPFLTALSLTMLAACGPAPAPPGALDPSAERTAVPSAEPAAPPLVAIADAEDLESFLTGAGVTLIFNAEAEMDYLPGLARVYQAGADGSLEVHSYASPAEAELVAALIHEDGRWIDDPLEPDVPYFVDWRGTPHAFRKGSMLVIYIGRDPLILQSIEAALGPAFAGG
jgi:hypothetical protein